MGKMLVVFKREYLERVRSKWFIIATIFGPVLMGMIMVVPAVMAARTKTTTQMANVIVVDATGTDLGDRVAKALASAAPTSPAPRVKKIKAEQIAEEEKAATEAVIRREAIGYLLFDANTIGGKEMKYAGRNATSLVDVSSIERITRQSLLTMRLEREGLNAERVQMLTAVRLEARTEKISDRGRDRAGGMASLIFGYLVSFILYFMIAIYGQSIMRGVLEEKTSRVAEVVVSSVKPDYLLAGKILGSGSVALTQVLAWGVMSWLMYLARTPVLKSFGAPPAAMSAFKLPSIEPMVGVLLLVLLIFGFIFYAALFGAVGAMVSNQEDVQQAATPVMLMLVSAIIFMQPILMAPSSGLAITMSILPFSAPMMMPLRIALVSVPWYEMAASVVSVVLGSAAAIWLSARVYRVGLLMYGKRPTVKELVRWIKMA